MSPKSKHAFPCGPDEVPGLTLRDYFAAHAPAVPDWFVWHAPAHPKLEWPRLPKDAPSEDLDAVSCYENAGADLPEHLRWYAEKKEAFRYAKEMARNADQTGRVVAWRWHYATAMVAGDV